MSHIIAGVHFLVDYERSQTKFSEKTGIDKGTVSNILRIGKSIRSDKVEAIAKAYPNLNLRKFLTGEGDNWWIEESNSIVNDPEVGYNTNKKIDELEQMILATNEKVDRIFSAFEKAYPKND